MIPEDFHDMLQAGKDISLLYAGSFLPIQHIYTIDITSHLKNETIEGKGNEVCCVRGQYWLKAEPGLHPDTPRLGPR